MGKLMRGEGRSYKLPTGIQGTACGFLDEGYLSLKIITPFLPPLPDYAKITRSFPSCPFV